LRTVPVIAGTDTLKRRCAKWTDQPAMPQAERARCFRPTGPALRWNARPRLRETSSARVVRNRSRQTNRR